MVFKKDYFRNVDFEKNQHEQFLRGQRVYTISSIFLPKIKVSSLRNCTGGAELYAHAICTKFLFTGPYQGFYFPLN